MTGPVADMVPDGDCECICNHSGACTGCGICWIKAYYEHINATIRTMFAVPWLDGAP